MSACYLEAIGWKGTTKIQQKILFSFLQAKFSVLYPIIDHINQTFSIS